MARRRMIDPSIWDDEAVGSLSDAAFKLFISCISYADDSGKLEGSPAKLRAIAFRFKSRSLQKVEAMLKEIEANVRGFRRYSVDGRELIILLNWDRYQRVDKPQPSRIPDPPFLDRSENGTGTIQDRSSHEVQVQVKRRKVLMSESPDSDQRSALSGCPYCRKPSSNPDLQLWHDLFLEVKGMCPTIKPAKDGATLKALHSAGRTDDEVAFGIRSYLQHQDPWIIQQGHALDILGKRFDAYRNGVPVAPSRKQSERRAAY